MGGVRMEAEELEQLNPAIKGKKLEIVDEVCPVCHHAIVLLAAKVK